MNNWSSCVGCPHNFSNYFFNNCSSRALPVSISVFSFYFLFTLLKTFDDPFRPLSKKPPSPPPKVRFVPPFTLLAPFSVPSHILFFQTPILASASWTRPIATARPHLQTLRADPRLSVFIIASASDALIFSLYSTLVPHHSHLNHLSPCHRVIFVFCSCHIQIKRVFFLNCLQQSNGVCIVFGDSQLPFSYKSFHLFPCSTLLRPALFCTRVSVSILIAILIACCTVEAAASSAFCNRLLLQF